MPHLVPASALVVALLAISGSAFADEPPAPGAEQAQEVAVARALLVEGRKLLEDGRLGEAQDKLLASVRESPSAEALLALGTCHEKLGATASAWGTFVQASERAQGALDAPFAEQAARRASEMEARLFRVKIFVSASGTQPRVKLDDRPLEKSAWGVGIPADPGLHRVVASAPGKRAFSTTFEALPKGGERELLVPELAPFPPDEPTSLPWGHGSSVPPPRFNGQAMFVGGGILAGVGGATVLLGALIVLNNQQAPAAGLGTILGGAALIPPGVVLMSYAGKYWSVSALPPRLVPSVARTGGGLSLQGAF